MMPRMLAAALLLTDLNMTSDLLLAHCKQTVSETDITPHHPLSRHIHLALGEKTMHPAGGYTSNTTMLHNSDCCFKAAPAFSAGQANHVHQGTSALPAGAGKRSQPS
jgi:hypothetical protein